MAFFYLVYTLGQNKKIPINGLLILLSIFSVVIICFVIWGSEYMAPLADSVINVLIHSYFK